MKRSTGAVIVLTIVAIYCAFFGADLADGLEKKRDQVSDAGLAVLAYALVLVGCLCTAAVLWSRSGQSRGEPTDGEE